MCSDKEGGVFVRLSVLLAVLIVLGDFSGLAVGSARCAESDDEKPVLSTAAGWGVIGGLVILAASTGAYFLHRHNKRQVFLRDSVATVIEERFSKARKLHEEEKFKEAAEEFRAVLGRWGEYKGCRPSDKRPEQLDSTKLVRKIGGSEYLHSHMDFINMLRDSVPNLPLDPYELVRLDRLEVQDEMASLRDTISSVKKKSEGFDEEFRYGFGEVETALDSVDQIFHDVYEQQALNFSLKSKFFYNQARETKDTADLRRYVQDCDYYQCEKSWCEKARFLLDPPVAADTDADTVKEVKDTVMTEYRVAMESGRLDMLEVFLEKYADKKYRKYRTVIDSANQLAVRLRKEMDAEMAYNRAHPLFSNADVSQLELQMAGVSDQEGKFIRSVLKQLEAEVKRIAQVRFPAFLSVDFSKENGSVALTGFVNCEKDVETVQDSSTGNDRVHLPGAESAMEFLFEFRQSVKENVGSSGLAQEQKKKVLGRVDKASLIVRLRKSSQDYVTFYARVKDDEVSWYDFYDISVSDKRDVRVSSQSVPLISSQGEKTPGLVNTFFRK